MDVDLSPKAPQEYYGSDGGAYYIWSSADVPMLSKAQVGAGKLVLKPRGLALPHYADSSKIGYVLQGSATFAMVSAEGLQEKVVKLKQGDAIPLRYGVLSWWYNDGDSEFAIVFFGETSKAHVPGLFTYFFLTGRNGMFTGLSPEFLSKAWDLDEGQVTELVKSQTGQIIVKVKEGIHMPEPCQADAPEIVYSLSAALLEIDTKNAGRLALLTASNLPSLGEIGLSADLVKLDPNASCSPGFSAYSGVRLTYIVKGSGRVEIVGRNGDRVLEAKVTAGTLFVVPRFFVVTLTADGEGIEWFSVITNPQPIFTHLAGKTSLLEALSPQLVEAAFNVTPDVVKLLQSKNNEHTIFFPPRQ